MTFAGQENSNYSGQPVSLYDFSLGSVKWRYTSNFEPVPWPYAPDGGPTTYTPIPIKDDGVIQSGDSQTDDLKITVPRNLPLVSQFMVAPPSGDVSVIIREMHKPDDGGPVDAPITFMGSVQAVREDGPRGAELLCRVISATFNRNGLRTSWSRQCQHALYDSGCKVDKELFKIQGTVSSLTGNSVFTSALAAVPNNWLDNGFLEFVMLTGAVERRAIEFQIANTGVQLLGVTAGLSVGKTITMYPGCPRTTAACKNKFNNLPNYGGYPHMPGKSPFDGNPIY